MLYIKNKIINKDLLSPNGYLSCLGIIMLLRKGETCYFINTDCLSYILCKKYPADINLKNNLYKGVVELERIKWITFKETNHGKQEWIIDTSKLIEINNVDRLENINEFYTAIDKDEISKILLSSGKYYTKQISLIRFYSYILSTIYNKEEYKGVGFTSISDMAHHMGYNEKTVSEYIKTLEGLQIIYVFTAKNYIKFEDGGIAEISNTYGRWKDKDDITRIGQQHEDKYGEKLKSGYRKIKKNNTINSKRYSQMYNHICKCIKDGKEIKYSNGELKMIYNEMIKLNDKNKKYHKERVKDLSIFSKYCFYKND